MPESLNSRDFEEEPVTPEPRGADAGDDRPLDLDMGIGDWETPTDPNQTTVALHVDRYAIVTGLSDLTEALGCKILERNLLILECVEDVVALDAAYDIASQKRFEAYRICTARVSGLSCDDIWNITEQSFLILSNQPAVLRELQYDLLRRGALISALCQRRSCMIICCPANVTAAGPSPMHLDQYTQRFTKAEEWLRPLLALSGCANAGRLAESILKQREEGLWPTDIYQFRDSVKGFISQGHIEDRIRSLATVEGRQQHQVEQTQRAASDPGRYLREPGYTIEKTLVFLGAFFPKLSLMRRYEIVSMLIDSDDENAKWQGDPDRYEAIFQSASNTNDIERLRRMFLGGGNQLSFFLLADRMRRQCLPSMSDVQDLRSLFQVIAHAAQLDPSGWGVTALSSTVLLLCHRDLPASPPPFDEVWRTVFLNLDTRGRNETLIKLAAFVEEMFTIAPACLKAACLDLVGKDVDAAVSLVQRLDLSAPAARDLFYQVLQSALKVAPTERQPAIRRLLVERSRRSPMAMVEVCQTLRGPRAKSEAVPIMISIQAALLRHSWNREPGRPHWILRHFALNDPKTFSEELRAWIFLKEMVASTRGDAYRNLLAEQWMFPRVYKAQIEREHCGLTAAISLRVKRILSHHCPTEACSYWTAVLLAEWNIALDEASVTVPGLLSVKAPREFDLAYEAIGEALLEAAHGLGEDAPEITAPRERLAALRLKIRSLRPTL
jgi:hypothetical protein